MAITFVFMVCNAHTYMVTEWLNNWEEAVPLLDEHHGNTAESSERFELSGPYSLSGYVSMQFLRLK